ncbi:PHB depolymerase family esterase [Sphaerothrix gracilis]|uniref:alpha/beta hydrolase family esterase n=1 Tax=Sphaerothrix gracilis TaxID=3151835 RepID=UPI0031FE3968
MLKKILCVGAGVMVGGAAVLSAAYLYLIHTSTPEAPRLSAPIQQGSVQVGGLERTYQAYVPADLPEQPALLLAFHGSRADSDTMRVYTGYEFERLADQHGFIVVYPDGYEQHWNDCRKSGPYAANTLNVDDLGFVRALIRRFATEYGADTSSVFAVGFSNGGHMAYRLALEMPRSVHAVAAIGANLPTLDNLDCTPSGEPVSVLIMNGTNDPLNPFTGGEVNLYGFLKRGTVRSAQSSAEYFVQLAGTDLASSTRTQIRGDDADEVMDQTTWTSPNGPTVSLYAVHGGGHTIAQPYFRFPRLLGTTPTTLNAPDEIWKFFTERSL